MGKAESDALVRHMHTLFTVGAFGHLTDGQLLDRYRSGNGEAAELAFAALVDRHGPMVLRACRAVLRDHHDACDAFQATFLVLIRRAPSLWVRDSLGAWLHQVAHRTASCARADAARRRRLEQRAAELTTTSGGERDELGAVLHEEIARLPDRYRSAVVLCLLEGLTREQAARRLGCPTGTVESRLARGRERLRLRLSRRGIASAVGVAAFASTAEAGLAPVPAAVVESIMRAAMRFAACGGTTGATSASVAALAEGVLRTMLMTKLKTVAATLSILGGVIIGAGALAQTQGDESPLPRRVPGTPARFETVPDSPASGVLKLTGPARGERIEVVINRRDSSERLTLEGADNGMFVITHDLKGSEGRKGNEGRAQHATFCSSVEISALREPRLGDVVYDHPRLDPQPRADAQPRVDAQPPVDASTRMRGGMTPTDRENERRLDRLEQKLDQILKAIGPGNDTPTPTPFRGRGGVGR